AKNEKHQEEKKRQCCCDADPGLVSRPPAEIHGMDCTGSKGSHLLNPSNRSDRVILSSRSNVFSALDRGMMREEIVDFTFGLVARVAVALLNAADEFLGIARRAVEVVVG